MAIHLFVIRKCGWKSVMHYSPLNKTHNNIPCPSAYATNLWPPHWCSPVVLPYHATRRTHAACQRDLCMQVGKNAWIRFQHAHMDLKVYTQALNCTECVNVPYEVSFVVCFLIVVWVCINHWSSPHDHTNVLGMEELHLHATGKVLLTRFYCLVRVEYNVLKQPELQPHFALQVLLSHMFAYQRVTHGPFHHACIAYPSTQWHQWVSPFERHWGTFEYQTQSCCIQSTTLSLYPLLQPVGHNIRILWVLTVIDMMK